MPLITVITVCRNEYEKIRKTSESICTQSFGDFEWVVIDGGSSDGTLDILREYEENIAVLVTEPDAGIYNAMNKGIRRATGEYVVFMNGGDCFSDADALQRVADAPRVDIVYGDLLFDGSEPLIKTYPDALQENYLLDNMLPHQASFIRRSLFDDHGMYDESYKIAGDYELFARLLVRNKVTYHHIPFVLAAFDGAGISKNPAHRAIRKQENHRVRMMYFPRYRRSLKAFRQTLRNYLSR